MRTRKRRLAWLLAMLLLFARSLNVQASMDPWGYVLVQPSLDHPWGEFNFYFYNSYNWDSFFTHWWIDGCPSQGPALYIDGDYICNPDDELAWPGSDETGNDGGIESERGCNGWWKNTYNKTTRNKSYSIRFFDPNRDGATYGCTIVPYIWNLELDKPHTVTIKGWWKTNNVGTWVTTNNYTFNAVAAPFSAPTGAKMKNYNHFTINGDLHPNYYPTWVGTTANATGNDYIHYDGLTSYFKYSSSTSSYSNLEIAFDRTDYYNRETKPVEYIIKKYVQDRGDFYLYKWFNVSVPGFVRATSLQTEADIWSRKITVRWEADDSDGRSPEGTWRIYRRMKNGSIWTSLVDELGYNQRQYVDDDDDLVYDQEYEYKVIFIPKGAPSDLEREELTQTVTGIMARSFTFSQLEPAPQEMSVQLSWTHDTPSDGSQLEFKVWRCLNKRSLKKADGTYDKDKVLAELGSTPIATVASSSQGNSTTYNDGGLSNNMTLYLYVISVEAFGQTWYSDVIGPTTLAGHTEILNMTANRGTYSNVVKVQWDVKHVGTESTRYIVSRRLLGSDNDEDYQQVHVVSGTEASYYFEDNTAQPGQFYQYRVVAQGKFQDPDTGDVAYEDMSAKDADGFCQSRGTISGRITYGTGTAVADARVLLTKNNETGDASKQFYSMRVNPKGGIKWTPAGSTGKSTFQGKPFTFQLYVRPDSVTTDGSVLIDGGGNFAIQLKRVINDEDHCQIYLKVGSGDAVATGLQLRYNAFTSLSVSNNGSTDWTFRTIYPNDSLVSRSLSVDEAISWTNNDVVFGCDQSFTTTHSFTGYLDDIRLWSKEMTDDELLGNYDRLLIGTEPGLKIYWPMDEGVEGLPFAYDYSKTSGVANENHGRKQPNTNFSIITPSDRQLRLYGKTDKEGNYVIRGVPFSGEGTSYMVRPTLGEHKFSPQYQTRFVNMEALTHNAVDFEDVSSFTTTGVVYYEGTTIPVKDVMIYVDGTLASKDGEAIKTDANGQFSVDVPIGDHFIQVKKNGHTFVRNGRYPDDPDGVGTRFTFESEVRNLGFYDNTRVTVAGRVAGGDLEFEKPLGMKKSKANIGKAQLTLTYANNELSYINAVKTVNGAAVGYSQSDEQRDFDASTPMINSKAYVKGGENRITIETDPLTGEWAAELLPLRYTVESVVIPSATDDYSFTSLPDIDATNPESKTTDSLSVDSVFKYVASAKIEYKSPSIIDLTEHPDGSFGEKTIKVKDIYGNEANVPFYAQDDDGNAVLSDGKVQYAFARNNDTPNGCPVYLEMGKYTYEVHAYERYVNKDAGPNKNDWVNDEVPLSGKTIKIDNQYATGVTVRTDDGQVVESNEKEFELDDDGRLTYNFQAGLPNPQSPYDRGISIVLDDDGTMVSWEGNGTFRAVVLGSISTGSNFVTQAPDEVRMILRDPPGTNSSATFSKGHTFSEEGTLNILCDIGGQTVSTTTTAAKLSVANGVGVAVITETNTQETVGVGIETSRAVGTNNSWVSSTTTTTDISTSSDPEFVGAPGDVFYGVSKNNIFGKCHIIKIKKNEETEQYELVMEDGISQGNTFGTVFAVSQFQIENRLIPEYEGLRDELLQYVANPSAVPHPAAGENPIYVTTLTADDPRFGTNNHDKSVWGNDAISFYKYCDDDGILRGPSYWMILPTDWKDSGKMYQDMVQFYNEQVKGWKQQLANNERAKVTAIERYQDYLIDNYTIDGGATLTRTTSTSETDAHSFEFTEELKVVGSNQFSTEFNGNGASFTYLGSVHEAATTTYVNTDEFTSGFSFTLAESGEDDYITVDVYDAPDKYGPIFVTMGGATSCPYEDVVTTKYYRPGTKIGEKTVQIEKPEIEARVTQLTGIPAGGVGTFQVYIRNNSDTSEDGMYNINVVPGSNPDGLVVKMDGLNITTGRAIMVKAGEPMLKTFTVEQTNPDVLTYEDIQIRISSQCQPNNTAIYPEIADTTTISVYFQPSCSDIQLASSHRVVNNDTQSPVTLSISGYNRSMASLKGVRLEYKGESDADFKVLQEYSKDTTRVAADPNVLLLPTLTGVKKLEYVIDLREDDFTDKTYVFRAVTVCMQGGVEVNNESDEISIVRDRTAPQLIATPSPASGILTSGDDLLITFNEDIQGGILSKPNNFDVVGVLNESEVAHDVALSLTGENTAKTDATMDLSGKSFSASLWMNYQTNGTLLTHGTADNNFSVAIESGHLAVSVAGQKTVSTGTLPTNKWIYLNVGYEAGDNGSTPTVSAGYAYDIYAITLFDSEATKAYDGNGVISVGGNNLTAKVQELSLWNSNRSLSDAQADMHLTKSQYTSGLIGYWQMDEGRGGVATDRARARNMVLPSENAWWINGANYALTLDGTSAVAANIGSLNTIGSEDYLVEAWFKADKEQNGVASVLATQKMDLRLNSAGKMEMETLGKTYAVNSQDLRDGQWHHLAVNVLKSTNGSSIVYIDGQQCAQIAASAMPVLYGDKLMLGSHRIEGTTHYDQMLKGAIDEVRIWKGRRTANVISENMYSRVKPNEAGLVAYYPMEKSVVDLITNQIIASGSVNDTVTAGSPNAVSLTFYNATGQTLNTPSTALSSANTAALKQAPKMENVQFSFVASERQIKVNLNEDPAKIEGCNIYLTAKGVRDLNGNKASAITWVVYVQQNKLRWQQPDVTVNKAGTKAATFTATIENTGAESEVWSLSGLPTWLSASTEGGMLMPQASGELTFTVDESLPIGTYETTVYLTGSQNIKTPLNITVTSEGDAPNWKVTPGENTMTIVGKLVVDGVLSNDPKDIVAAFRGTECVGVASPKYYSRYDSYMVLMIVYGNTDADIVYKAFDASTGTIYPSVGVSSAQANRFAADKEVGSFLEPATFTTLNEIEQDLSHDNASWKWFSLYAKPKTNDMSVVFKDAHDAITTVTDGTTTLMAWSGTLGVSYDKMYKLNATAPYLETLIGEPTNPDDVAITLNSGWTWLGYPCQASNSLESAFAGAEPQEGDLVKNQSSFAIYTENEWVGTLGAMQPGDGYMYKSNATTAKTFHFPKPTVSGRKNAPRKAGANGANEPNWTNKAYRDNMTMIAVVKDGDRLVDDAQVSVYCGTELRGLSTEAVRDGRHFLTIGGNSGEADALTFVVTTPAGDFVATASSASTFQADALRGSMDHPVVLMLGDATAIDASLVNSENGDVYDLNGRKLHKMPTKKGVYIQNNKKVVVK